MRYDFVITQLRRLIYVNLTSKSVTYVSDTFVTLDSGLNNRALGVEAGSHVLTHALPCRPCGERTCRNDKPLECLTSISVEDVVGKAERILGAVET